HACSSAWGSRDAYNTTTGRLSTVEIRSFRVFDSQKRGAASGRIAMPSSRQANGMTEIREGTKAGCSIQPRGYLILNSPLYSYKFRAFVYSESRVDPGGCCNEALFSFLAHGRRAGRRTVARRATGF